MGKVSWYEYEQSQVPSALRCVQRVLIGAPLSSHPPEVSSTQGYPCIDLLARRLVSDKADIACEALQSDPRVRARAVPRDFICHQVQGVSKVVLQAVSKKCNAFCAAAHLVI